MSQTVIGFFDKRQDAESAVQQLESEGIGRDRIDISAGNPSGRQQDPERSDINPVSGSERDENSVRRTADDRTVDRDGRNTNLFTDFFNNLFGGSDDEKAGRYSRVAEGSAAIVTVHAQSREEAQRVSEILDDCDAIDVDEKAASYGYTESRSSEEGTARSSGTRSRIFDRRLDDNMRLGSPGADTW